MFLIISPHTYNMISEHSMKCQSLFQATATPPDLTQVAEQPPQ
jgi:hypothetical protein